MKREDFQVDGNRLLVKKFSGTESEGRKHFNWVLAAEFHHVPGLPGPEQMATILRGEIIDRL